MSDGPEWLEEAAALWALIAQRPRGTSVATVVAQVLEHRDAQGVLAQTHGNLLGPPGLDEARAEVRSWLSAGDLKVLSVLDEDYPAKLRAVHDAPPFIFVRGDVEVLQRGGICVVGTRKVSPAGAERAEDAVRAVVEQGLPVLSGLAYGVDTVAHESTLRYGGTPIGVIASSITGPYTPAASRDLHEHVAQAGALVSQFPPGARTHKASFLMRNATMSGLSDGTLVVEAGESSGTRAQARNAMSHGRPVILSQDVAVHTNWGRELASGARPNVFVVSRQEDLREHVGRVRRLGSPDLERLDAALRGGNE